MAKKPAQETSACAKPECKQAVASLSQTREWAETILKTVQCGVLVVETASHKIIHVNRAAEMMIGAGRDEIIGQIYQKYICPPANGEGPIAHKDQQIHDAETVLNRSDGGRVEILTAANCASLDDRECIIECFIDIFDRKRAEADLRAHRERFKTFFSSVDDAIFVHPLQEEGFAPFIEVNDIACKRYGYSREEFCSLTAQDITDKTDVDHHATANHRKKLLDTKHLFFETVHVKKSGETFPVEINANIVQQYGKPVILAVVRDISERKRAEAERSQIEAQYLQAQKVEAIGQLAGGVAHDLNNILSPIIGFGELLIDDMHPEDNQRESVNQIVQAGYRARDLVRQLLAFGRKQTLAYRTIDLNQTLQGFESLLRRTIREDITIEILPAPKVSTTKADMGQIEQVIMNLCVNAQDSMPDGGQLTLLTDLVKIDPKSAASRPGITAGTYVMLSISDTGCGMDKETQSHIFEPFFSTKGEQGTGLGLSTVYGIIKQHGGSLWVDSQLGEGSTFNVYLPVSAELIVDEVFDRQPPAGLEGTETILIVEDSEQVRTLSRTIFRRQGYTTMVAENGTEALKILASHKGEVDLILTDVVMPDMNGKDLFMIISKQYPSIKVLYMSGYTDNVIAHRGILEPGVHLIHKPFSVQALCLKVRKVLDSPNES